jgi:hypothetical protein
MALENSSFLDGCPIYRECPFVPDFPTMFDDTGGYFHEASPNGMYH